MLKKKLFKVALKSAIDAENDLKAKGLATTEAKAQVERAKQAVKSAEQAVKKNQKIILNCLRTHL
ncbi:MAG: hypothetical protein ACLRZG_01665 [Streptococcus sp.]